MPKLIAFVNRCCAVGWPVRCSVSRTKMSPVAIALLLIALCAMPNRSGAQTSERGRAKAPARLREAVGCLVATNFVQQDDLKHLGLKLGDWAWVRYQVGSISGLGDTQGQFNVAVYSADGRNGMLLFAEPNKQGSFDAILNAYRLHRSGSKWTADYGNGGYVLYEAVGRFATGLMHHPRYRIQLLPGGSGCTADN